MADTKISALTAMGGSSVDVAADKIPIVDTSATTAGSKSILPAELAQALGIHIHFDAASKIPRTTGGGGVDSTETSTYKVNADFITLDATTAEYAQAWFVWPIGWNTCTCTFFWQATTGTGSVRLGAQIRVWTDADAQDSAFGTAQEVTDAAASANTKRTTAATSAITPSGTVTGGKLACIQVYRDPANGADDMAVDAYLQGVLLQRAS